MSHRARHATCQAAAAYGTPAGQSLSRRELKVLQLIAAGKSNREASWPGLSPP